MAVPHYYELFNPTLKALHELGGSATINELNDEIARMIELSEEDAAEPMPNRSMTRFAHRTGWARTYLKTYGLLENTARGVWALTLRGKDTAQVDSDVVKKEVRKVMRSTSSDDASGEDADDAAADADADWVERMLAVMKNMDPSAFERLCQRFLRESGFVNVEVTGSSGDGGIDGHGVVKIGGLLSFHVNFQCKRFKGSVTSGIVRDFRGAMVGRADKGLIISTGVFTRDAKNEAKRDGAPPIDLIDGEELANKLKELELGVRITKRIVEDVEVLEDWFAGI